MRAAVFAATMLTLWRDRAAFALTFILPPIIYAIFAAVFSAAAGGDLSIRLGVAAPADEVSLELVDGLSRSRVVGALSRSGDGAALEAAIIRGEIDVGIEIIRNRIDAPPAFRIYFEETRSGAATVAEAALAALAPAEARGGASEPAFEPAEKIIVSSASGSMAAYYAAGVGMLFVFLSGFQSALSVIDERDSGVMDRIAAGPAGLGAMVDGKFIFLVAQGTAQLIVVFAVAWIFFGVNPTGAPLAFAASLVFAAISAAGLSLAVIGCCGTRSQGHAVGSVLALVMGALGGSMAPRFLMAPEIRDLGAATPNAWGIDAFGASLWRGADPALLLGPWSLLLASGIAGLIIAHAAMARTLRW